MQARCEARPAEQYPTVLPGAATKRAGTYTHWLAVILASAMLCGAASSTFAYEPEIHQKLTFIAAKQLNRCLAETELPGLNALQVRIIAKANTRQADTNLFTRMFRWNYYDRSGSGDRDILWVIDTRFDKHFDEVVERLARAETVNDRYRHLGRIVGYVQDVTSPPHAVPVYANRWWRFSLQDRFDRHPVDEQGVAALVSPACVEVLQPARDYHAVLENAARDTLASVQSAIEGLPVTWEVFWQPHENPARFGTYGPAGNRFGRSTGFPCGQAERCVLLDGDPLYKDFAMHRHAAAVAASLGVMILALRHDDPANGR